MSMEIEQKIRDYIVKNLLTNGETFTLSDDDSLFEHDLMDSLGILQILAFVDSEFDVRILPGEVSATNFDSVNRLAAYIRGKLGVANTTLPILSSVK